MNLLDDGIVPEHAREIKAEAREFAEEYIEPNAREYFQSGEYPTRFSRPARRRVSSHKTFRRNGAVADSISRSCSRSRRSSTAPTQGSP